MKIDQTKFMNEGVRQVFDTFREHGDIRIVGGTVRDIIMDRPINDVDFATPLTPNKVSDICKQAGFDVIPTGLAHGTVTVIWNHEPYEITTLRRDVETDGRRAVVAYTTDWAEDAYRRDFRFNALYMAEDGTVYDHSPDNGGINDALNRRISFMGDAEQRVREDYLRILRMFRFMSALNGECDSAAVAAASAHKNGINTLSGERLEKEVLKMLSGVGVNSSIRSMVDTGVFSVVFGFDPDDGVINRLDRLNTFRESVGVVPALALVIGWQDDVANVLMDRWKASNMLRQSVVNLIARGPVDLAASARDIRKMAYEQSNMRQRIIMSFMMDETASIDRTIYLLDNMATPAFPVRGQDVIDMGVPAGKQIGVILKEVEDRWIEEDFPTFPAEEWLKEAVCIDRNGFIG